MSISVEKDCESRNKKQGYSNQLSENRRKGNVCWGGRVEKEGQLVELVGDTS